MGQKVLILNADYRAFAVCGVHKAFLLVYLNKAEMIDSAKNYAIRTITRTFEAPSVIRLMSYVTVPYKGVMLSRQNIYKRDNNKCVYCGAASDLTLDHVLPRSRGGETKWNNLVTACKTCNARKGDFTPEEAAMHLPYQPYKPSFVAFLKEFSGIEENWLPFLQKQ